MTCDAWYDSHNAEENKTHQHPEPQSGVFRSKLINSGLEYSEWLKTVEGEEWSVLVKHE